MTKNKIKLTLIDDYIKICLIKNFLCNNFNQIDLPNSYLNEVEKLKQLNATLEQIYCEIFEKLHLNNLSLDILKKDLKHNNSQFENEEKKNNTNYTKLIDQSNNQLNSILFHLKEKLQVLKLNILSFNL